jgi:isoleucyl-tRNA synthetase
MVQEERSNTISFKETLNLPRTDFPIRSNAKVDDPALIKRWETEQLYAKAFVHNAGKKKFILHDGPPYANGHLHIGHAYNKILKDMATKSQRMAGNHVPVTPGWDCHGLPIELAVSKEFPHLELAALKKECRAYATKWISVQKEEFKRLAVVMDWDNPYLTMNFSYEADTLRAFSEFVAKGYIERKNKTVPWCFSCKTVLAAAEIEYYDRKDPSLYVLFPLEQSTMNALLPDLKGKVGYVVIWTTTPWTIPLNRAVLAHPRASYVVLEDSQGRYILVGQKGADALCTRLQIPKKVVAQLKGSQLLAAGGGVRHPFIADLCVPLIGSDTVNLDEGTAFVHCAPGCGPEDYEIGVTHNLEIYSPITPEGTYTADIQPAALEGMSVTDGQIWVLKKLQEKGHLLHKESIQHSYPHCWRCRNGLIFRATKQWFCDLAKNNLKHAVLQEIETLVTFPPKSINRLKATVAGRLEWCLSRQRIWGVPIPALICTTCDTAFTDQKFIESVADQVEKQGVEYWDSIPVEQLQEGKQCAACKGEQFKKETDILDVWFDSGISHYAVLCKNPALAFPADMYLEGKDQHRGWFQSSLLTSMVLQGRAPMKEIFTHGFTVDEKGRKMSKSLGNVVLPEQMLEQIGTDGVRLWVASIDNADEAVVSDVLMRNVQEVFRKIRNTCRFLLSNLYDFEKERDALALEELFSIDRYALQKLAFVSKHIVNCYERYDFTALFHALADYSAVELSSFYLDIIKDRLYVEKADGHARRSAQTACWYILDTVTKLIAPVLSCTAEYVSDHYQKNKKESIHLQQFADTTPFTQQTLPLDQWFASLKEIRGVILKQIETLREKNIIKHSLEAAVTLTLDPELYNLDGFFESLEKTNQDVELFFKELCIVSQVTMKFEKNIQNEGHPGILVHVAKAHGVKCPRCWNWEENSNPHGLCNRCTMIVASINGNQVHTANNE